MPTTSKREQKQLQRYLKAKDRFEIPMMVLTVILAVIVVMEVFVGLPQQVEFAFYIIDFIIWVAFAFELIVLTYMAPDKKQHLQENWFNVLIVLLPIFRVARIARILRVIPVFARSFEKLKFFFLKHKFNYVLLAMISLVTVLGLMVVILETHEDSANIQNSWDGLWWAVTTMTAVGYGDLYPVTNGGRTIGMLIMVIGVITFSMLTANVTSFLIGENEDENERKLRLKVEKLENKIDKLIELVEKK